MNVHVYNIYTIATWLFTYNEGI